MNEIGKARWWTAGESSLMARLSRMFAKTPVGPAGPFRTSSEVLDRYVAGMPSKQNAIDSVPGWIGAMPPQSGLNAGAASLYADTRIAWLLDQCYSVAGKSVLELGPLEGFHTYMLHQAEARSIDAVEANTLAFVRCLITKEVLNLPRANFLLGDFMKWLEHSDKRYDLVVASGVLYHSHDPVHLLELIARKADTIFLWTHYFDDDAMPPGDLRRVPFSESIETRTSNGVTVRLHERSYYKAWRDPSFCGGIQDRHFWIDRADILGLLSAFGFDRVMIADEQPNHINGPSFSVFAERTSRPAIATAAASEIGTVAGSPTLETADHTAAELVAAAVAPPPLEHIPEPAQADRIRVDPLAGDEARADSEPSSVARAPDPASPAEMPADRGSESELSAIEPQTGFSPANSQSAPADRASVDEPLRSSPDGAGSDHATAPANVAGLHASASDGRTTAQSETADEDPEEGRVQAAEASHDTPTPEA